MADAMERTAFRAQPQPTLKGPENWRQWSRRMETLLGSLGLEEAIERQVADTKKSQSAKDVIISSVADPVIDRMETNGWTTKSSARATWTTLEGLMGVAPQTNVYKLLDEWQTINRSTYTSLRGFMDRFRTIERMLEAANEKPGDKTWVARILNATRLSLPEDHAYWQRKITAAEDITKDDVLKYYTNLAHSEDPDDHKQRSNNTFKQAVAGGNKGQSNNNNKAKSKSNDWPKNNSDVPIKADCGCFILPGRAIHPKDRCWMLHPELRKDQQSNNNFKPYNNNNNRVNDDDEGKRRKANPDITNIGNGLMTIGVMMTTKEFRDCVVIDSGCSHHTFNSKRFFTKMVSCEGKMSTSNGSHLLVEGIGTVEIPTTIGKMILCDVQYAPSACAELLSPGQLRTQGIFMDELSDKLIFKDHTPVASFTWKDHIAVVDVMTEEEVAFATLPHNTRKEETVEYGLMHQRLGHAGRDRVITACEEAGIKITAGSAKNFNCEACHLGKADQMINRARSVDTEVFLSHVYLDFIEHKPLAYSGHRYTLHFIDGATGFHWTSFCRERSGATNNIINFINTVENHSGGFNVQTLLSDNAPEFDTERLQTFFTHKGIHHRTGAPWVSAHQGRIERAGRALMEMARTTTIGGDLPEFLWPLAVEHACRIANVLPTTANIDNTSPIRKMFRMLGLDYNSDLKRIRTFGCVAYVRIPETKRSKAAKMAPRAYKGRLVGIEGNNHKIYKVWVEDIKQVVRARDVRFKEEHTQHEEATAPEFEAVLVDQRFEQENDEKAEVLHFEHHVEPTQGTDEAGREEGSGTDQRKMTDDQHKVAARAEFGQNTTQMPTPEPTPEPSQGVQGTASGQNKFGQLGTQQGPTTGTQRRSGRNRAAAWDYGVLARHGTDHPDARRANAAYREEDVFFTDEAAWCLTTRQVQDDVAQHIHKLPRNWAEAFRRSDYATMYLPAEEREMDEFRRHEVFELVDRVPGTTVLPGRWIYTMKTPDDADPFIKARWTVRGDLEEDDEYTNVYSAVASLVSLRVFCTDVAINDLECQQADVVTAFLHAKSRGKAVYTEQPHGHTDGTDRVCLINRAINGLRESPLWWFEAATEALRNMKFEQLHNELCIFINNKGVRLLLYVDDLHVAAPSEVLIKATLDQIEGSFKIKRLGSIKTFLGMHFQRNRETRTLFVHQSDYIDSIITKFDGDDLKAAATPWPPREEIPHDWRDMPMAMKPKMWLKRTGRLNWVSQGTRPDITYTVNKLCAANAHPSEAHVKVFKHLLRYLKGPCKGITLGGRYKITDLKPRAYADAAYADDLTDRRSTAGFVVFLADGPILWKSKKQNIIAKSTTEAEFINLLTTAVALMWVTRLTDELTGKRQPVPSVIFTDSANARITALKPSNPARTRHFDIRYKWVIEKVKEGQIEVVHVGTQDMAADGFTKPLLATKHKEFLHQLGM